MLLPHDWRAISGNDSFHSPKLLNRFVFQLIFPELL